MDESVDVRSSQASGSNAYLVVSLTILKLKVLILSLTCSSQSSTELTLDEEVTLALRCFYHRLYSRPPFKY
jgi:hypothetical protein